MTTAREFFDGLWDTLTGRTVADERGMANAKPMIDGGQFYRNCTAPFVRYTTKATGAEIVLCRDHDTDELRTLSSDTPCDGKPYIRRESRMDGKFLRLRGGVLEPFEDVGCIACASADHPLVYCVLHSYAQGDHSACVINTGPWCGEPVTNGQIEEGDAHPIDERGPNDGKYEHVWCVQGSER